MTGEEDPRRDVSEEGPILYLTERKEEEEG
jgi:hypothetical protein